MADIQISDDRARTFADALQTFEKDGDVAAFAALFADDAVTQRLDARGERRGEVEQFWKEYRDQFTSISTSFYDVVEGGDRVALEWTSDATLTDGRPLQYRGVTVLDLDGNKISKLRTYYDSAQFTPSTGGHGALIGAVTAASQSAKPGLVGGHTQASTSCTSATAASTAPVRRPMSPGTASNATRVNSTYAVTGV